MSTHIDIVHIIKDYYEQQEEQEPYSHKGVLCGQKNTAVDDTVENLKQMPLKSNEKICGNCEKHPKYALMVLAALE